MSTILKIAKQVMSEKEKEIMIQIQLENICQLVDGKMYHKSILNSRGERTEQIVIEYSSDV